MKITDIRTVPLAMPLDKPIGNATAQITVFSYIAIYLDTDAGITGENLIFTIRPEQVKLLDAIVHVLRDAIIGRSPDDTAAFWADAWKRINFIGFTGVSIMGISAIDGAMWDLRGKAAGLSISRLLGRARQAVPAYASGGLWLSQSTDELVEQAGRFAAAGFKAMKLRLAGRQEVDLPRLAAMRQAIGDDVQLMVDANQVLDAKAAIRLAREMEAFDISWFEEPVPAHDLAQSAEVTAALDMPIASGENEYTLFGFKALLDRQAADVLMPDLQRVGGVSEFFRVGALAAAYGKPVSSHLFPEMSLQLMGSIPNASLIEHVEWFSPLYQEKMQLVNGQIEVPDQPGWGFALDPDAISHFSL